MNLQLQTRHRRLMKEHADPSAEFDFQALRMALQVFAAVLVVLLVLLTADAGDSTPPGPGANDQPTNHAAGFRLEFATGDGHVRA